jgi:hypothetical protein
VWVVVNGYLAIKPASNKRKKCGHVQISDPSLTEKAKKKAKNDSKKAVAC